MEHFVEVVAHHGAILLDAMAIVIIAAGSLEAFVSMVRTLLPPGASNEDKRAVWLRYSQALVAGLTFQLAADIVHTSISPTWHEIGQLAAIAAIRSFISFFLGHDVDEVRARRQVQGRNTAPEHSKTTAHPSQ